MMKTNENNPERCSLLLESSETLLLSRQLTVATFSDIISWSSQVFSQLPALAFGCTYRSIIFLRASKLQSNVSYFSAKPKTELVSVLRFTVATRLTIANIRLYCHAILTNWLDFYAARKRKEDFQRVDFVLYIWLIFRDVYRLITDSFVSFAFDDLCSNSS